LQHRGRRVFEEEIWGCRWDERDAEVLEEVVPGEMHGEIAGEAVGALDDDGAHAVAGDAVEVALEVRMYPIASIWSSPCPP
jgi:hypothetical protein